ncbi:MAG: class I SAM-dependent methyltransferase, partial [Acidimicrobiia bacterium]
PSERTYTVPEFLDALAEQGLSFGRWFHQAPYRPQCGAPATTPHAARLAELNDVDQYTAMELVRGSMARHTVIAHDATATNARHSGGWVEDSIPIRLPDAITVEERLPPGAAAVLINTAHTDTDLVLAVTSAEKRLVDKIDGHRTLSEIAANAGAHLGSPDGAIGGLFERLWLWDQVVFNQSHT